MKILLCMGLGFASSVSLFAALIDLDAFVSTAILGNEGTAMANGSTVYIMGSGDSKNEGMQELVDNNGMTNIQPDSVMGDDVILGVIRIGENASNDGSFFTTVQYDPDEISFAYLRFFEYTGPLPMQGVDVAWGTSVVYQLESEFGVASQDFNSTGDLIANNENTTAVDSNPPNLLVPDDVNLVCGSDTSPANTGQASATDDYDTTPEITYVDEASSAQCPKVITRTWTAVDDSANSVVAKQTITLMDPPSLVLDCEMEPDEGSFILSWHAFSGWLYQLQCADDMPCPESAWQDVEGVIVGDDKVHSISDKEIGSTDRRFYRVVVFLP